MTPSYDLEFLRALALDRLRWSREFVLSMVKDLHDTQLVSRAGGKGNHPLWVLGHLAWTEDALLATISGTPSQLPERLVTPFQAGSEPTEDLADYPGRGEVLEAMANTRQRFLDWVRALDIHTAAAPTPDRVQRFAPSHIALALTIPMHELMHAGQVATVRAALGIPPVVR